MYFKVTPIMKNCFVYIVFNFILFGFVTSCAQLGHHSLNAQSAKKESAREEEKLSANYYYLESRIHIKNREFSKAVESLQKAVDMDDNSFILTRDLVQLYLKQNRILKMFLDCFFLSSWKKIQWMKKNLLKF